MKQIDCNYCKNISITEDVQLQKARNKEHIPLKCKKYNTRLVHCIKGRQFNRFHNRRIEPCRECKKDNFKLFESK